MFLRHARSRRQSPIRLVVVAAMTLAGLATVPTQGADGHLERPKPHVQMPAAERWRLRPAQPVGPGTTGSIGRRVETPIPPDRRAVRLVYPALNEVR
ncbi:hypothetical protein MKK69_04970 [Methylobacterium sp. J-026]|uniref:hypothetical protein n=1 Tax=Methylobacterium sp. J-026 TaxID=2836624 RepID=UPI001FB8E0F8|nr:hypothetical protein [Methylobacterium sp. J-026]MCJ2133420.1 hypothetical protein [Methylobacterium sp. J-026]